MGLYSILLVLTRPNFILYLGGNGRISYILRPCVTFLVMTCSDHSFRCRDTPDRVGNVSSIPSAMFMR
jgi:hypothetical protein